MKSSAGRIHVVATMSTLGALMCWSMAPNFVRWLAGYVDPWTQNVWRYVAACVFWGGMIVGGRLFGRPVNQRQAMGGTAGTGTGPGTGPGGAEGAVGGDSGDGRKGAGAAEGDGMVSVVRGFHPLPRSIRYRALVPTAFLILCQTLSTFTQYYIDPAFKELLTRSAVVWVAVFSMIVFREERSLLRSRLFWVGLVLSVGGLTAVLVWKEGFGTESTVIGIVLSLVLALVWGMYTVSLRVVFHHTDSRSCTTTLILYATVGLAVLAVVFGEPMALFRMPAMVWVVVVISGWIGVASSHVLYTMAIKRIGPTLPSLCHLAIPFGTLAISWVLFDERLSAGQWVGGVVLIAGAGLSIWAQKDRQTHQEPPVDAEIGSSQAGGVEGVSAGPLPGELAYELDERDVLDREK